METETAFQKARLAFGVLIAGSAILAVITGKLSLIPLLVLGAALLLGAQFVFTLAERAKQLSDAKMG